MKKTEQERQELREQFGKRFNQILEYSIPNGLNLNEKDEDPNEENVPAEDVPMPDGGAPDMGGNPTVPGEGQPMGDEEGMSNMVDQEQSPEGFNPQVDDQEQIDDTMSDEVQPDDDVIDVTELINSQEETEGEVNKLTQRLDKALHYLGKLEGMIKSNNETIKGMEDNIRAEIERRNPTQIEKLNMQTANSYPFNIKPEDYWKEKEATSNYRVESDDNGKEQGQYVITQNDVDGAVDWKSISDSLKDHDPSEIFDLHKLTGIY